MTGELENSPAGEHDSLSAQYGNFLAFASTLWAAPNWILRKNMVIDFSKLLPQEYEVRTTVDMDWSEARRLIGQSRKLDFLIVPIEMPKKHMLSQWMHLWMAILPTFFVEAPTKRLA